MYSSRGGLGIGSTIEGAEPILSKIGLPEKIENDETKDTHLTTSHNHQDEQIKEEAKKEGIETKQPDILPNPLFYSDKSNFKIKLDKLLSEKMESSIEDAYKSYDPSLWSPILRINSNGQLLLEWERI